MVGEPVQANIMIANSGTASMQLQSVALAGTDPVATVLDSCVGCGVCGENAHAASLCPSFYRSDLVYNPTRRDRALAALRKGWIGLLSVGVERRAALYEVLEVT